MRSSNAKSVTKRVHQSVMLARQASGWTKKPIGASMQLARSRIVASVILLALLSVTSVKKAMQR